MTRHVRALAVIAACVLASATASAQEATVGTPFGSGFLCGRMDERDSWAFLARAQREIQAGAAAYVVELPRFEPDGTVVKLCDDCDFEPAGSLTFRVDQTVAGAEKRSLRLSSVVGDVSFVQPLDAAERDPGCFVERNEHDAFVVALVRRRAYLVTVADRALSAIFIPYDRKAIVGMLRARSPEEFEHHLQAWSAAEDRRYRRAQRGE